MSGSFKQRNYVEVAHSLNHFNISHSGSNKIDKILCPILIYHGKKDLIVSFQQALDNAELLGKNRCTVVLKEEVGHCPPYDSPIDLCKHILNFCQKD